MLRTLAAKAARYGEALTRYDWLKLLAMALMTIDHIGFFLDPPGALWWRVIGRLCVPIWFFLIGYARPDKVDHSLYVLTIVMIAADLVLMQPVFPLTILVSLVLARIAVGYLDTQPHDRATLAIYSIVALAFMPPSFFLFEYGTLVVLFSFAGYYYRHHKDKPHDAYGLLMAGMIGYGISQSLFFEMEWPHIVLFALGLMGISWLLIRFDQTPYLIGNGWIAPHSVFAVIIRYCARNSAYYYVGHYIILMLIAYSIEPTLGEWRVIIWLPQEEECCN